MGTRHKKSPNRCVYINNIPHNQNDGVFTGVRPNEIPLDIDSISRQMRFGNGQLIKHDSAYQLRQHRDQSYSDSLNWRKSSSTDRIGRQILQQIERDISGEVSQERQSSSTRRIDDHFIHQVQRDTRGGGRLQDDIPKSQSRCFPFRCFSLFQRRPKRRHHTHRYSTLPTHSRISISSFVKQYST